MMDRKLKSFLSDSVIVLVLSLIAGGTNYVFQIVTGNLLTTEQYGTANTLISASNLVGVITSFITLVTCRYIAEYQAKQETEKASAFLKRMLQISMYCIFIALISGFFLSGYLGRALKIAEPSLVYWLFIIIAASFLTPALLGAVQGFKDFLSYGIYSVLCSVLKLVVSVLFIKLGYSVSGIMIGMLCSMIAAVIFLTARLKRKVDFKEKGKFRFGEERKSFSAFFLSTFLIQACLAVVSNGDVLLIRQYVSETEVGLYSSAMVIGKIPYYLATSVTTILFPMTVEAITKQESSRKYFIESILIVVIPTLLFAVVFGNFSSQIIGLFFNDRYADAAVLLKPVCMMIVPVVVLNIEANYLLALNKPFRFAVSMILSFISIIIITYYSHESTDAMIHIIIYALAAAAVFNLLDVLYTQKRKT
ncbi:MAG: hypothetical protein VZT48_04315 [Bulleidia sp.]|nr:hypothetical protein [Bulleidia sp.]